MTKYKLHFFSILFFLFVLAGLPLDIHAESPNKATVFSNHLTMIPLLKEPAKESEILISIPNQSEVTLLEKGTHYTYVCYLDSTANMNMYGYIDNALFNLTKKSPKTPTKGVTYYVTGASTLNIHKDAGTKHKVLTFIKRGTKVTLYEKKGNWGKVKTKTGISGWASLTYLSTNPPSKGLKGKIIVIDAGHGGKDSGAVGSRTKKEKNIALQTAKQLQSLLQKAGAIVILTRSTDEFLSLSQRVNISHAKHADAFISIHYNSSPSKSPRGIETYYWKTHVNEYNLAKAIQDGVIKTTGLINRGVKSEMFYVIRENKNPAVLVELGFVSNPSELKMISTSTYQKKAAKGIFIGLNRYFNL